MRYKSISFLTLVGICVWLAIATMPDGLFHMVFCDVGQGDAVLVYKGTTQMLIDGGPDNKVIGCLEKFVPFYDNTIEVVVMTHPDADHAAGLVSVLERYAVIQFVSGQVGVDSHVFTKLLGLLQSNKKIKINNVTAGDQISLGFFKMKIVWPNKSWLLANSKEKQSDKVLSRGEAVLGATTSESVNHMSVGGVVSYGDLDVMLTGDGDGEVQENEITEDLLKDVEVVKVPHHGSRFGANVEWYELLKPELAVISVGKNSFGHPTEEVLNLLKNMNIQTLRTDREGDVEIVSDGKRWWVK